MKKNMANVLIALMWAWAIPATAQVIYDNGTTPSNSFVSDTDFPEFVADDFSLAPGANVITGVQWTGLYFPSNTPTQPDNFTIQFFADVGGSPVVTPFLSLSIGNPGRTDTGIDLTGSDLFAYSANVAPITLAPNTVFWLSVFNNTLRILTITGSGQCKMRLATVMAVTPQPTRGCRRYKDRWGTGKISSSPARAIPEPSVLALLAIGVIGLLGCRRKRAR